MNYFLLKAPTHIGFIQEEYAEGCRVPNYRQIRFAGNKTNAKLVKLANGEWYIRVGKEMLRFKSISTKQMKIARLTDNGGEFTGIIDSKWFLEKNK